MLLRSEKTLLPLLLMGLALSYSRVEAATNKAEKSKDTVNVKKACAKYEGKYIAYYSEIFQVKGCKRHVLSEDEQTAKLGLGNKVIDVSAEVIRLIPEAKDSKTAKVEKSRSCKQLEGKYVSYTSNEVYLVQNCRKRIFTDWETFEVHSKQSQLSENSFLQLTWNEFQNIADGRPMPSTTDEFFKKDELAGKALQPMPVAAACKGLNGKYVAYYSGIYRIENCKKRLIKDEEKVKQLVGSQKLEELDSNKWISLPQGKPIEAERDSLKQQKAKMAASQVTPSE